MPPRVHLHEVEAPRPCSYLEGESATLENKLMTDVGVDDLEAMMVRGWRRFGPLYFRPACTPCGECRSLRIPVDRFQPTDSQRRALRRIQRFRITFGRPGLDAQRLDLYRAWHSNRERDRGWEPSPLDAEAYFQQFAFPHPAVHELALYEGDDLKAVGIYDVTPRAMSAVYFFYAPDIARLSPGVANVMVGLEVARAQGIPHLYLGYRVLGCASLRYKDAFRPHELLEGRPALDEEPRWVETAPP
jgi:arginine-tRNA-protein transferase